MIFAYNRYIWFIIEINSKPNRLIKVFKTLPIFLKF